MYLIVLYCSFCSVNQYVCMYIYVCEDTYSLRETLYLYFTEFQEQRNLCSLDSGSKVCMLNNDIIHNMLHKRMLLHADSGLPMGWQ